MNTRQTHSGIDFYRIDNNSSGAPRYVCHFLALNTQADDSPETWNTYGISTISHKYAVALKRAKQINPTARKFHNKQFGGGIAFCTYDIAELARMIRAAIDQENSEQGQGIAEFAIIAAAITAALYIIGQVAQTFALHIIP